MTRMEHRCQAPHLLRDRPTNPDAAEATAARQLDRPTSPSPEPTWHLGAADPRGTAGGATDAPSERGDRNVGSAEVDLASELGRPARACAAAGAMPGETGQAT
jgi:hypothetical protein